jgi:hypothetical protein
LQAFSTIGVIEEVRRARRDLGVDSEILRVI